MAASQCVSDARTLARALAASDWDAVVAAQPFAPLSIEAVMQAVRDRDARLPVIAAVRAIGAEAVADLMRAGARDVVAMENGERLRAVLEREAGDTNARDFSDAKQLLENIALHVPGDIYRRVLHADGRVTYPFISGGFIERLGYGVADIEENPGLLANMVHGADQDAYRTAYADSAQSLTPVDQP